MDFFSPSLNSTLGAYPIISFAFEMFSCRLGWPSGLLASQTILPVYPTSFDIIVTRSAIFVSSPDPMLIGFGSNTLPIDEYTALEKSSTYRKSLDAFPVPQMVTVSNLFDLASMNFLMSAGITWLLFGLKSSCGPYMFVGIR